jgi:hypothetical protein
MEFFSLMWTLANQAFRALTIRSKGLVTLVASKQAVTQVSSCAIASTICKSGGGLGANQALQSFQGAKEVHHIMTLFVDPLDGFTT